MSFADVERLNNGGYPNDQELAFLLNYLAGRSIYNHLDTPVTQRFPYVETYIQILKDDGMLTLEGTKYVLTPYGLEVQKSWRKWERERKEQANAAILQLVMNEDYLGAYNMRAKYERECILPHGIGNQWDDAESVPVSIVNYIKSAMLLDFSDLKNSKQFIDSLRKYDIAQEITGGEHSQIPQIFYEELHEKLHCAELERQLKEFKHISDYEKFCMYIRAKQLQRNLYTAGEIIKKRRQMMWNGNFLCIAPTPTVFESEEERLQYQKRDDDSKKWLLRYDEFLEFRKVIPEICPKTFKTFEKHKLANDEKYQKWLMAYNDPNEKMA